MILNLNSAKNYFKPKFCKCVQCQGPFFKLDFCYMYAIAKFQKCEVNFVPKI